jgi:hypothetical protein
MTGRVINTIPGHYSGIYTKCRIALLVQLDFDQLETGRSRATKSAKGKS